MGVAEVGDRLGFGDVVGVVGGTVGEELLEDVDGVVLLDDLLRDGAETGHGRDVVLVTLGTLDEALGLRLLGDINVLGPTAFGVDHTSGGVGLLGRVDEALGELGGGERATGDGVRNWEIVLTKYSEYFG